MLGVSGRRNHFRRLPLLSLQIYIYIYIHTLLWADGDLIGVTRHVLILFSRNNCNCQGSIEHPILGF